MNPTITSQRASRLIGVPLMLSGAALVAAVAVVAAYRVTHAHHVYPGVHVDGVHVGGISPGEALQTLAVAGLDPGAPIVFTADDQRWEVPADEAGVLLDARATVEEAFGVGRGGVGPANVLAALAARLTGVSVHPIITVDQDQLATTVAGVAANFDYPAENAGFAVEGTTLVATEAVTGRVLDVGAGMDRVLANAGAGTWPMVIELPVQLIQPAITDAGTAHDQAEALLAAPIVLESADGTTWDLPADALAAMLEPRVNGTAVGLGLDESALETWMEPIAAALHAEPVNARLGFDTATGEFTVTTPSVPGRALDMPTTASRILAAGGAATRRIQIAEQNLPAAIGEGARAADFGITTLIHEETSHFVGSPSARIHNIGLAADRFDGALVPPDAVYSFNDAIGDITAEVGYRETKIIMDGTTADGVGGGVCQVSTTLFRLAFWAGLPIAERHAHGYRVAYYEQNNVAPGLDATIYRPSVDFKFKNDTGGWLLIETVTRPREASLTFRLYGRAINRNVTIEGPVVANRVAPPAGRVEFDPAVAPGASETLEYSRPGADVTVVRITDRGAGEPERETFFSRYRPTGEVLAVGPPLVVEPAPVDLAFASAP